MQSRGTLIFDITVPPDKKPSMQPHFAMVDTTRQTSASNSVKVAVRSARGDGTRVFVVSAASSSVAEVKQLLCRPPYSLCTDASLLVLVVKGDSAAIFLRLIAFSQIRVHAPYLATTLHSPQLRLMRASSALLSFSHPAQCNAFQLLSIYCIMLKA